MKIYIDESGNTGDLIRENLDLNFANQNIFTLAAIQIDENLLYKISEKIMPRLRKKYNIQGKELKSSQVFDSNPMLLLDLMNEFDENINIYIEVVGKKAYICNSIVGCQICPPYYLPPESLEFFQTKNNVYSDLLVNNLTKDEYLSFFKVCEDINEKSLFHSFDMLKKFSKARLMIDNHGDIYKGMLDDIIETEDDYGLMLKSSEKKEDAIKRFIPIPDLNKNGKKVNLLPQISCLTNIIARVNYLNNSLDKIQFIHDEQKQFDDILESNIDIMYELNGSEFGLKMKGVNFNLLSKPNITIDTLSHNDIGIQIADILAGFMMRYVKRYLESSKLSPVHDEVFNRLMKYTNFVLSISDLKKLGIPYSRSIEASKESIAFENLYYQSL